MQTPREYFDAAHPTESWPDFVRFSNAAPDALVSVSRAHLFADIFPTIDQRKLDRISIASELFETMINEVDAVLDGDRSAALSPLDLVAIQFEAYRIIADLFPGDAAAWDVLRRALVAYAEMIAAQREFAAGRRSLLGLTYADAVGLAQGKSSLATVVVTGLGTLAGQPELGARVAQSVDRLMVAKCFADDLLDWRRDAELGQPSYPLALAATTAAVGDRPVSGWSSAQLDDIGHSLYFEGVADQVVKATLSLVEESRRLVAHLPAGAWRIRIDRAEELVRRLARNLPGNEQVSEKKRGGRPRQLIRMQVEESRPWHTVARLSATSLLQQWRLSFPDAVAVSRRPGDRADEQAASNVFTRALIAHTLAVCDGPLTGGQLRDLVQRDVDYVLSQRGAPLIAWVANPDAGPPPCAMDEIAEIVRLMTKLGLASDLAPYVAPVVAYAAASAGPEVLASLLTAVWTATEDSGVHGASAAACERILQAQEDTGEWSSQTYHGNLYSTYQCMAAIARLRPDAQQPLRLACDFVLARQNGDGGWSNDTSIDSDALGTAIALCALAQWEEAVPEPTPRVRAAAERALTWLTNHREQDGSYPAVPLLVLRATHAEGIRGATGFGSRSLTTALVCQAALAWDGLL